MTANQRRAFEFVGLLLKFYGDYRTQKEREAYVVTTLYLGATGVLLVSHPLPTGWKLALLVAGVVTAGVGVACLVCWQLKNLRFAARMVGACVNVSSQWLHTPPGAGALYQTPLCGHAITQVPADVDTEFKKQKVTGVRIARGVAPLLIAAWGVIVGVVLCLS